MNRWMDGWMNEWMDRHTNNWIMEGLQYKDVMISYFSLECRQFLWHQFSSMGKIFLVHLIPSKYRIGLRSHLLNTIACLQT